MTAVPSCTHDKWRDIMKLLIHIESKVQTLGLVAHSVQEWGLRGSSFLTVQLHAVQQSSVWLPKPQEWVNQPCNSPPLNPTAPDQPCSVHSSSLQSTALNHTDKSSSLWLIFFTWMRPWNECCLFLFSDKCRLDKADQRGRGESKRNSAAARSPQLNVHTSSSMTRKSSVSARQQLLKV